MNWLPVAILTSQVLMPLLSEWVLNCSWAKRRSSKKQGGTVRLFPSTDSSSMLTASISTWEWRSSQTERCRFTREAKVMNDFGTTQWRMRSTGGRSTNANTCSRATNLFAKEEY